MAKRYSIAFVVLLFVLTAAVFSAGSALAANPERYIIFTEDPTVNALAVTVVEKNGGTVLRHLGDKHQKGLVVEIDQSTRDNIAAMKGVKAVEPDVKVTAVQINSIGKSQPVETLPWGIKWIKANNVWDADNDLTVDKSVYAGAGIKVAIVDSGIDKNHPDLKDNLAGGINFVQGSEKNDNSNSNWDDRYGHGTHVAGICAAVDNSIGVIGAAPYASLYSVRVLGKDGGGYVSDLIDGIYWCGDNGMDIANLSVGVPKEVLDLEPNSRDELQAAVNYAYEKGVLLVAAAGNLGPNDNPALATGDNVDYPARFSGVLAVSAIDQTGARWPYSKVGPAVAIAAPGVNIFSTFLKGSYLEAIGTSMAAPHVSGTAALVMSTGLVKDKDHHNGIANEVREILCNTAVSGDPLLGSGVVDAAAAVRAVQ